MDSGFELDLDSFLQLPSSDDVFLKEDIDDIDEEWWQGLCLPSPSHSAEDIASPAPVAGGDDGAVTADASACCSHSSGISTTNVEPVDVVATSSPEVVGSKRSAVSSPEIDQDDPKRARRLEKNREAASQSRARKKSYVKELEVKCRMLEAHVAQLQRVVSVTSMENTALKDELVRVKKPKDGRAKSGVAEPAVLESNSLPSEFLRRRLCHFHMGQYPNSRTAGLFQGFLLALLQLLMLAAVNGPSDHQASQPQPQLEGRVSFPAGMELDRARPLEGGMATGWIFKKKKGRHRQHSNSRWASRSSERSRMLGRKRRRVKHLRSSRIL